MRTFNCFDFDVAYNVRPGHIYQEILPDEIEITLEVPDNFDDLLFEEACTILKPKLLERLQEEILFDTPDEAYFEVSDVTFSFEEVHDIIHN